MSTMSIKPLAEDFFEKYVPLIVPWLDDVEKVLKIPVRMLENMAFRALSTPKGNRLTCVRA